MSQYLGQTLNNVFINSSLADQQTLVYQASTGMWTNQTAAAPPGGVTLVNAGTGITITGSAGSPIVNLATSGATAGTYSYPTVTVNAQGQITGISSNAAPISSVTAGTGIILSGTGAAPIININSTGTSTGAFQYPAVTVNAQGQIMAVSENTSFNATLQAGAFQINGVNIVTGDGNNTTLHSQTATGAVEFQIHADAQVAAYNTDHSFRIPGVYWSNGGAGVNAGPFASVTGITVTGGIITNPMTTAADMLVGGTSGLPTRLPAGTGNQILTMNAGATAEAWNTDAYYPNPMTAKGDILVGGTSGLPTRLAIGGQGAVLAPTSAGILGYSNPPAAGVNTLLYNSGVGIPAWVTAPRGAQALTATATGTDNNTYPTAGNVSSYAIGNLNFSVIGIQFQFTAGSAQLVDCNISGLQTPSAAISNGFAGVAFCASPSGGNVIPLKLTLPASSSTIVLQTLGGLTPLTSGTTYLVYISGCYD